MADPSGDLPTASLKDIATKEQPRVIEKYLPQGFPQLLFHGTSRDNATRIQTDGPGDGTVSSWLYDCLDSRFYRANEGRLIVISYSADTFQTDDLGSKLPPYQYYFIRESTGPQREIVSESIDTDGVSTGQKRYRTTCFVDPQQMGALQFIEEQREYLDLMGNLLNFTGNFLGNFDERELSKVATMLRKHNLPDSAAGVAGAGTTVGMEQEAGLKGHESLHYRFAIIQRQLAKLLGIPVEAFADLNTLQQVIDQTFPDEELFFDKVSSQFPGNVKWDWKNIKMSDKEILAGIIRQLYQKSIIDNTKSLLMGYETTAKLTLKGKSTEGLNRLRQERGIS